MKDDLLVERKTRRPHRLRARKPPSLHIAQILAWADAWFERTGQWPIGRSGHIPGTAGEKWNSVDVALRQGLRGLPGGSSLARLLAQHRGRRNLSQLPSYTIKQILTWADAHRARTGQWPEALSGSIPQAPGETWLAVNSALSRGARGLPGGSSLARLLARHRGARIKSMLPRLSVKRILAWADAWFERTGRWPMVRSGHIPGTAGEKWNSVQLALRNGFRGLPGGSSLARLLAQHRGKRNPSQLPPYTAEQILAWADAHHARTGHWPNHESGAIPEAPGETWCGVNGALRDGTRGLPGGSSLARLLAEHRGVANRHAVGRVSVKQILGWADAHFARTGRWPDKAAGRVVEMPWVTWLTVDKWLRRRLRGLRGGKSLLRLLEAHGRISTARRDGRSRATAPHGARRRPK